LFNVHDCRWDKEILDLLELRADQFPQVASRNAVIGAVTQEAAARFGLPEGIPVVNGTGDGFAANIGSDCETPDRIAITLGTSGVVRQTLPTPALVPAAGTFCYLADESTYLLGCAGSNGGNVLDWGRRIFGLSVDPAAATDPPTFIPLLHGERSPEWNPDLTGSWHGLTSGHTAADLARSILEGVIFNLAYFVEIVQATSGRKASTLVLSGNGFLSPLAAPILAAVAGIPVLMPQEPGLITLRGTALCALRALSKTGPPLRTLQISPLDDPKILLRYAEYRRFRGTLGRA
jgi:gluconokinase